MFRLHHIFYKSYFNYFENKVKNHHQISLKTYNRHKHHQNY